MLHSRPTMHIIDDLHMFGLERAIHIYSCQISTFVAVAAIRIDGSINNIFWPESRNMYYYRANNIMLVYVRRNNNVYWRYITVQNIAMICASSMYTSPINVYGDPCAKHIGYSICWPIVGVMHTGYDNMIVFNSFNMYCQVWTLLWPNRIGPPSQNYYCLGS